MEPITELAPECRRSTILAQAVLQGLVPRAAATAESGQRVLLKGEHPCLEAVASTLRLRREARTVSREDRLEPQAEAIGCRRLSY